MVYGIHNWKLQQKIEHKTYTSVKMYAPENTLLLEDFSPSNKFFVKSTVLKPYKTREIDCILIPKDDLF